MLRFEELFTTNITRWSQRNKLIALLKNHIGGGDWLMSDLCNFNNYQHRKKIVYPLLEFICLAKRTNPLVWTGRRPLNHGLPQQYIATNTKFENGCEIQNAV
jgi:hypothetical protein